MKLTLCKRLEKQTSGIFLRNNSPFSIWKKCRSAVDFHLNDITYVNSKTLNVLHYTVSVDDLVSR